MEINPNAARFNLAHRRNLAGTEDSFGKIIRTTFLILAVLFPWLIFRSQGTGFEQPREVFLFAASGVILILWFLRAQKRREIEWRRTRLNWLFYVWLLVLALGYLYADNYQVAWRGYNGSYTAGFCEYVAFLTFFFMATQFFSAEEWKKKIYYFMLSLSAVAVALIFVTLFAGNSNLLTANFARTPTLVAAAAGVTALALWWSYKREEAATRSKAFLLVLLLFFVSSLFDFPPAWWMWAVGTAVILVFNLASGARVYRRDQEERRLGMGKYAEGFVPLFFRGKTKYLSLIFLLALSRAVSPLFLGQQKMAILPFTDYFSQYAILGQRVYYYLLLNLVVFGWGLYYFFRRKEERRNIVLVMAPLLAMTAGHLLYYTESAIYYFLNWLILVFAGLTFLRKTPEKDFLYPIEKDRRSGKIFFAVGLAISALIIALTINQFLLLF